MIAARIMRKYTKDELAKSCKLATNSLEIESFPPELLHLWKRFGFVSYTYQSNIWIQKRLYFSDKIRHVDVGVQSFGEKLIDQCKNIMIDSRK